MDAGNYVAGAVTLNRGDVNTGGFAFFKIAPRKEGVRQFWAQEAPASMTAEAAKSFDFSAVVTVDGVPLEDPVITYTYQKKGGLFGLGGSSSREVPTEPGEYTQTAVVGGNYATANISRTFIIAEPALLN